jgi:hypothetical protein
MFDSLAKLFGEWFSNPKRGLVTLAISSIVLLVLWQYPPFGSAMRDEVWRWPCIVLVVSVSGLATYPLGRAWEILMAKRTRAASERKCIARLNNLTLHEKHVLRRYLLDQTTTHNWGKGGGTVDALAADGILSLLYTDPDTRRNLVPDTYRINEVAWRHLNAHPELIDLTAEKSADIGRQP